MKNSILKYTFVAVTALFITSCSSDDNTTLDTTKPEVKIVTPLEDQHLHPGDVINFEALLKDDVELGKAKVDIHFDGDGHTHAHKSAAADKEFSFNQEYTIPNGLKEHTLKGDIQIPADITAGGHYHFGIIATDKAGNETQNYIEIEIAVHGHEH